LQTKKLDAGVEVSLDAIGSNASSIPQLARHLADRGMTPGHVVQRVERSSLIESALQQLDEHDRELLTLRHFEQLSNDEVARILGVKKAAASRRSTRALVRLREALGDSISGDV
jgi:RNA polymerase sigma-70 factor (ECF subfamily)